MENERTYYEMLKSKNVCGIVVAPAGVSDIYDNASVDDHIVFVDSTPSGSSLHPVITIDNYHAAYELTEHLVSLGRNRIFAIVGPRCETSANDRVHGFLDCLSAHGLPTEKHVFECEHDYNSGIKAMQEILSQHKPDAIFTENNLLAYGAFSVIRAYGLRIPEDLSIACFDASDDFGMMSVAFTTIIQPVAEFGKKAVELIVGMNHSQKPYQGPMEILMKYEFIHGQST